MSDPILARRMALKNAIEAWCTDPASCLIVADMLRDATLECLQERNAQSMDVSEVRSAFEFVTESIINAEAYMPDKPSGLLLARETEWMEERA